MLRRTVGFCMILLAGLLGLVILLGVIGLFVSEKTDGKLSSVLVFSVLAVPTAFLLRFGTKLVCAKAPPIRPPVPPPAVAQRPGPTAVPTPGSAAMASPQPLEACVSSAVAFPRRMPSEPYNPVHDEESQRLIDDLLALNQDDIPFRIVDGRDEGVDLVAEWKIVDAEFYALFAAAGVRRVFRIYMKLDPRKRTVRTKDQEYGVRWSKGIPAILSGDYFQGQKFSMRWHWEIGLRKDTKLPGVVVNYTFNTSEMKDPIKAVIKAAGWRYKGLVFARL
jgi:hypothetical protein